MRGRQERKPECNSGSPEALTELRRETPGLRKAVIKLNEGFSGQGNAQFSDAGAPARADLGGWIRDELPARIRFEAHGETWERYRDKLAGGGGIAESFLEGDEVCSPSMQCRIDPLGEITVISTHDQLLGVPSGQVFLGYTFPADEAYSRDLQAAGRPVGGGGSSPGRGAGPLRRRFPLHAGGHSLGALGTGDQHPQGGATHPYLMLEYLTDGHYDPELGRYLTPTGLARYDYATDNISNPAYVGITPDDLIDVAVTHRLHFDAATQQGVIFHLVGAMSEHAKLGAVCIGDSHARAERFYRDTIAILDAETRRT